MEEENPQDITEEILTKLDSLVAKLNLLFEKYEEKLSATPLVRN
jgi:hypothetical protein